MSNHQTALIEMASLDHRDFDATLAAILRTDAQVIGVERVLYYAMAPDQQSIRCELGYIASEGLYERDAIVSARNCPMYFAALAREEIITADDARADPRTCQLIRSYLEPREVTSMMDVPVWLDGRLIGIICHEHTGPPRRWAAHERAFALSAAQSIATAVSARERRRVASLEKRASFLAEATMILAETLDIDEVPLRLVRLAIPTLGEWCTLDAVREDGTLARIAAAHVDPRMHETLTDLSCRYPPCRTSTPLIARALQREHGFLVPEVTPALLIANTVDGPHRELIDALGAQSGIVLPLRAHGRTLGVLSFVSSTRAFDVDDLRLAEDLARRASIALENARLHRQANEAIAARDEFLSIAAHELYTPLTALTLAADHLDHTSSEQRRMLDVVVRSARRLTHLVNALLDAVRTGYRRVPLRYEELDLAALARSVVEQLEQSAERAGCTLAVDAEAPVIGLWDEAGIEQVLTNLVTNAIKFGAGRPIEVAVTKLDERARVTVRDHGPGIDPAELPRLFNRFERGVSTRSYGGLGLGLYIARGIAEAHGGTLSAESEPGAGATFTLELPVLPGARLRARGRAERPS